MSSIPQHTVHIYQKPKLGNSYLDRYPVANYRHTINAIGWFDTANFDIAIRSASDGEKFLDQYLGNRVAIYVCNPAEPVWEGFINRMTFSSGGVERSISLDQMANRLAVTYTNNGGAITTSSLVSSAASQALFGIKNDRLELRAQNTGSGVINAIRDTALAQRAWPKASTRVSGGGNGLLSVECKGFYHTLMWDVYQDATVADVTLSNYLINQLLPGVANGTTFFDNTITSGITTNSTTIQRTSIRGDTIWDRMQIIRETGDGTDYYVIGITPTNFQTGLRSLYYRPFSSAVKYTARLKGGLIVRNQNGKRIDPWRVTPDAGIRITDQLVGWNGVGDNPTEQWIQAIDYDANTQRVTWRGDDDRSAEGAFNRQRHIKAFGRRWGAQYRV